MTTIPEKVLDKLELKAEELLAAKGQINPNNGAVWVIVGGYGIAKYKNIIRIGPHANPNKGSYFYCSRHNTRTMGSNG